jgi:3-hydroxyisobutyrate dehydrogenase-like beta-hydroxyacid dehydrogenase
MRLAILGMGRMGHALAERLLSGGHEVSVWNRTPPFCDGGPAQSGLGSCLQAD